MLNGTNKLDKKIAERFESNQRLYFSRLHFYAKRFIAKLINRVDQLIEFPESGRVVPEKNSPDIRELIEGNYRIFYRLQRETITILRIHNSARKIK